MVINTTSEDDGGRSFIATYTCVADNGIHTVNATARLRPPGTTYPYVKEAMAKEESRGQGERNKPIKSRLCVTHGVSDRQSSTRVHTFTVYVKESVNHNKYFYMKFLYSLANDLAKLT